jgi:hypothetical protein
MISHTAQHRQRSYDATRILLWVMLIMPVVILVLVQIWLMRECVM